MVLTNYNNDVPYLKSPSLNPPIKKIIQSYPYYERFM